MESFTWKNKDSYLDYGIVINTKPPMVKAEKNVEEIEIPGRDGDLTIDDNTYKPIILPMTCTLLDTSTIDNVKAWLDGYSDLIFSWQNDRKYKAKMINRIDIAQSLQNFGEFPLIFKSQPFGYSLTNNLITLTTSPSTVTNTTTKDSKPVIKVYGDGTIDLTVNSSTIHLTNVSGYVTIDSELIDCYKDTVLKNGDMSGSFPLLQVGTNNISWVSGVLQVETATVVGTITTAGNATVVVTASGMTGSPKTISVAVALSDTATLVAGKIRTALSADSNVNAKFTVGGTGTTVILTAKTVAANDATLNISIANGTCVGLTVAPTSVNSQQGIAPVSKVEITPNWRYL
jgi:predicted phage tail component-like protein